MSTLLEKLIGSAALKDNLLKCLRIKLKPGSVTTDKIADKAVTPAKLSDSVKTDVIQAPIIAVREDLQIAISEVQEGLEDHAANTTKHITAQERSTWNNKQDTLTFDNLPTQGSNNPVKSGGVYSKIQDLTTVAQLIREDVSAIQQEMSEKQNILTFDNTPTANSDNPVKSKGIKSAMDNMNSEIAEELAKKQEKLVSTSLKITGNLIEIPSDNISIGTLLEELEGTDDKHPRTVSAERLQYLFNTTTNLQKLMGKRAYGKYDKQGRYYTAPVKVVLGESSGAQLAHVIFYLIDENKEVHVNVSWLPGVLSFSPGTGYMKLNTNIENIFPINSNYRGSDRTTSPGLYLYNAGLDNGSFSPMLEEYATGLLIVTHENGIYSSGDGWNDVCQLFIDMNGNRYSRRLPYTNSVEDIDWTNAPDFILRS